MPASDDHRFRPGDATPDDYAVGEGYAAAPPPAEERGNPFPEPSLIHDEQPEPMSPDAPDAPIAGSGLPYGATGVDTAGGVAGGPPVAGPVPPGSATAGGWPPASPRRPTRVSRLGCAVGIVVALLLIWLAARGCSAIIGEDDSGSDPTTGWSSDPEIGTSWVVTPADVDPAAADDELALGVDGAFTGLELVDGGDVLVVGYGPGDMTTALAALDRESGAVLWHRDLGELLCGDQSFDEVLVCVVRENDDWVYHRLDIRTGADLATADTGFSTITTVHAGPGTLVVVGDANPAPHAPIAAFGPDGNRLWSFDLGEIDGAEYLFDDLLASDFGQSGDEVDATMERPRWRDLDDGLMMLWVTPGVAVIDPLSGQTFAHECLRAQPAHDRYFCQDDAGINRRDLTGAVVWSLPDLQLAYTDDTSDSRPVAVSEVFEVIPLDWETGEVTGPAIHRFAPQPGGFTGTSMGPTAVGDAQTQYLVQDGEILVALADGADEVAWVYEAEEHNYISDVFTIGDVTVIDSFTMVGLDRRTGEVLWRVANGHGLYPSVSGEGLVTIGFDEIAALELP